MNFQGKNLQSIWFEPESGGVCIIDQTKLPHQLKINCLQSLDEVCYAIASMQVRGAPLIGVTAAYGIYLSLRSNVNSLNEALDTLSKTRPTAVNLKWALKRVQEFLAGEGVDNIVGKALEVAQLMEKEDIAVCEAIGENGLPVLRGIWESKKNSQDVVNVLTHCNAGALAAVDWGTALSVIYKAKLAGIPLHVWVDETRPRNQGAALTCWELAERGVANTLIVDNAGGHLMQTGKVDLCVVGSDRTSLSGDVCNKIGTYLKALAANHNNIPFYVALPVSTIDFSILSGQEGFPIEERDNREVSHMRGQTEQGKMETVRIALSQTAVSNYGFDITPAEFVTGLITEKGIFEASPESLSKLL
ncbi:MAG: S-methyl-5-thioribose-1-phosphate isomerase [Gammaproteobacteria bacterium]|nr:S-methyl-5-thioribose-1-phosphate isomerase [Gammaproteobacteria bacterium]|tara:strand:+ start:441 stop:1520 length:1080 start_codon:yes stop_codon:yes gene_type:complete